MSRFEQWKQWARQVKRDVLALTLACRDRRVPWYAKATAACVVAYALSPIDLIPDFIPVFGYLDDLILVPLGVALAVRMIPPAILQECRERADSLPKNKKTHGIGAAFIIALWLIMGFAGVRFLWHRAHP